MTICVVGIDAVSLTLAAHYVLRGIPTVVTDRSAELVAAVEGGELPEPRDDELVWGMQHGREAGLRFEPSIERGVAAAEWIVFMTPLGYSRGVVDMAPVVAAAEQVGAGIQSGALLLVETTLDVRDTEVLVGATVAQRSGLEVGSGFSLSYCAPQCAPGTVLQDLSRAPRVFGGVDANSRERAAAFFAHVSQTILAPVRNCRTAELTRLYQLCQRGVSSAFTAEVTRFGAACDIDPQELTANTAAQALFPVFAPRLVPTPGEVLLGLALLGRDDSQAFARAALQDHLDVLGQTASRLADELGGLADKEVAVLRSSPVPDFGTDDVVAELRDRGARVRVVPDLAQVTCDAVVCLDPLPRMRELAGLEGCQVFVDGSGRASRHQVEELGLRYLGVVPFDPCDP